MNQPRFLSVHISLPCNISISTVIVHSHTFSRPIQHHKNWLCYRIHPSKYLLHPIFNDFMHLYNKRTDSHGNRLLRYRCITTNLQTFLNLFIKECFQHSSTEIKTFLIILHYCGRCRLQTLHVYRIHFFK